MAFIKGHSGCELQIVNNKTIRKFTTDLNYIPRIQKQCAKQRYFGDKVFKEYDETFNHIGVKVPEIINELYNGFEMEYFVAKNYIEYFMEVSKKDIDNFMYQLIYFLKYNIDNTVTTTFSKQIFIDKFNSIGWKDLVIEQYLQSLPSNLNIPVGLCHGDLTLSNILFKGNEVIFIDFLDTFCESPLQDFVKLRQDTNYGWSFGLYDGPFDKVKIKIILEYIDNMLGEFFNQYSFYNEYYNLFQIMNFIRIIPYCINEERLKFTKKCLEDLKENI